MIAKPRKRKAPVIRVGFITPCLASGGAERWMLSLSKAWSSAVQTKAFLCESSGGATRRECLQYGPVLGPDDARLLRHHCDILLAWGTHKLGKYREESGLPIVAVSHGSVHLPWACRVAEAMEPHADYLAAVSKDSGEAFGSGREVAVLYNGAEADRATPYHGGAAMRRLWGIPSTAKVALYAGRVSSEKRPWIAREMLDHLPENWWVVMAGANPGGHEFRNHPRFVETGIYERPGDWLDAADVFVLPSESEGHAIAMNEAWLAGVPTVSTAWPVTAEILSAHGVNNRTLPLEAGPAEWAASVLLACGEVERAAWLRAVAWRHFTAASMAARWEKFLSGLRITPGTPSTLYR